MLNWAMSLLAHHLSPALRLGLSGRVTPNGVRLEDVIRSGLANTDSVIGVYAPDADSYTVFRELFAPIILALQGVASANEPRAQDSALLTPAQVISTRVRYARNLSKRVFPAWLSSAERAQVEAEICAACAALPLVFRGHCARLGEPDTHWAGSRRAFHSEDRFLAAAGMYADWPHGRSVFQSDDGVVSVWINEEDHLRIAVVTPGASLALAYRTLTAVTALLAARLDFCVDEHLGYLTSCPSNLGTGMRPSLLVDLSADAAQESAVLRLAAQGGIELRGSTGEHSARHSAMTEISVPQRVGRSDVQMLDALQTLLL